jgi:hypothetical protein
MTADMYLTDQASGEGWSLMLGVAYEYASGSKIPRRSRTATLAAFAAYAGRLPRVVRVVQRSRLRPVANQRQTRQGAQIRLGTGQWSDTAGLRCAPPLRQPAVLRAISPVPRRCINERPGHVAKGATRSLDAAGSRRQGRGPWEREALRGGSPRDPRTSSGWLHGERRSPLLPSGQVHRTECA